MNVSARPNLLVLMVDQLAAAWSTEAITPHLDRLARRAARFTNAYSNSPLCSPARQVMMTGQRGSRIGVYDNAAELASSIPTFAHHLRAGGYQTTLIGKMHFIGADQLHGFEERLTTDIYPADFGWTPNWDDPDGRFDWWFHNMDSVTNAGIVRASNQLDYDDEVGYHAVRTIRNLARTPDDRPWMVTVSFTHPHDPYVARREFWDLYDHDTIPMPTVGDVAAPDPHSRRLHHVISADTVAVTDEQIRNARHAYLANTSYVDAQIGAILDTLDAHEMADDTAVLFTSDHGDMLGERGLWYKMNFFEPSAGIPMVVYAPGRVEPGVVTTPVSLLDVAPTLLDLAGIERPDAFDGDSLVAIAGDAGQRADRTVLGEYLGEGAIAPIFMIRRGDLKYVWSAPDPPQLYDLATDPHELDNLAATHPDADSYATEVHATWDVAGIDAAVRANQRARALVDRALRQGRFTAWDHQPSVDATNQYMRNHLDLNDVEASRRA